MAYENNLGSDYSFPASADLSADFGFIAALNASGQVVLAGANVSVIGVIQEGGSALGRSCSVRTLGIAKVKLGGNVTVNDKIASDSSGKGVKATAASVSAGTPEPLAGSYVLGIALATGSTGDMVPVLLTHAGLSN